MLMAENQKRNFYSQNKISSHIVGVVSETVEVIAVSGIKKLFAEKLIPTSWLFILMWKPKSEFNILMARLL